MSDVPNIVPCKFITVSVADGAFFKTIDGAIFEKSPGERNEVYASEYVRDDKFDNKDFVDDVLKEMMLACRKRMVKE